MSKWKAKDPVIATEFEVSIDDSVYRKIRHWMHKSDDECSGFGNVEFDAEEGKFRVTDAILLDQTNTGTSSEIDPEALGKAMFEMKDNPNGLKWWWHSHVDMGVFWSGDDMEVIRELGGQGWLLSTVFNRKSEMRSAFYELVSVMGNAHEIFEDVIPTTIQFTATVAESKAWDEDYDAKVKVEVVKPYVQRSWIDESMQQYEFWDAASKTWKKPSFAQDEVDDSADEVTKALDGGADFDADDGMIPDWPQIAKDGWCHVHELNRMCYNPAKDRTKKLPKKIEELGVMYDDEIDFFYKECDAFKRLVDNHGMNCGINHLPGADA